MPQPETIMATPVFVDRILDANGSSPYRLSEHGNCNGNKADGVAKVGRRAELGQSGVEEKGLTIG
jgi:hypothetical protein